MERKLNILVLIQAKAVNLKTGYQMALPQPSFMQPYRPILTVLGSHLVGHGHVTEGFATEDTLKMDDFGNNGWEARTVGDVSNSPKVVVSSTFFPDCTCDQYKSYRMHLV